MGKGKHELSQTYITYYDYLKKAVRYVRLHGAGRFKKGGLAHNAINIIREYGIVPLTDYKGLSKENEYHDDTDLFSILNTCIRKVLSDGKNIRINFVLRLMLMIFLKQN